MKFLGLIQAIVLVIIALAFSKDVIGDSSATVASAGVVKVFALKSMIVGLSAICGFVLFMLIVGLGKKTGEPMAVTGAFIFSTMIGFVLVRVLVVKLAQGLL
jgi:hypothetical protein